ncbi:MAG TPA: hypothetical protein VJ960_02125 [Oceanipulchritudo sp.]|nr:hypothetical protein [Oceanipulchritudo sp.]
MTLHEKQRMCQSLTKRSHPPLHQGSHGVATLTKAIPKDDRKKLPAPEKTNRKALPLQFPNIEIEIDMRGFELSFQEELRS